MKYIPRGQKVGVVSLVFCLVSMESLTPLVASSWSQICHRDLKLENTLLDGSPAPRLKICDFGYSKSSLLHSRPKSTVGTPAYIAPEVLSRREYDGKTADVWSCGVTLYVMLVGAYPFEDPDDPRNFRKTIGPQPLVYYVPTWFGLQRIVSAQYKIPEYVHTSQDCSAILSGSSLPTQKGYACLYNQRPYVK
ncbi:hypothetical protein C4D60_Mb11t09750 [Musa balbisiana]|uniref:non-specific serine/threonine protein kinase n=1 Tax=Musa balbisiana TaxID=52838 RepID=A0A4S8J2Z6_MUSBA|nr:hypothetical protein C4D60_Mb11t09750 [Musa balbisiana]